MYSQASRIKHPQAYWKIKCYGTLKKTRPTKASTAITPGFAQPISLAGRVKQTRQRSLTKPSQFPPVQYNTESYCAVDWVLKTMALMSALQSSK
jgi:hypothetical protein